MERRGRAFLLLCSSSGVGLQEERNPRPIIKMENRQRVLIVCMISLRAILNLGLVRTSSVVAYGFTETMFFISIVNLVSLKVLTMMHNFNTKNKKNKMMVYKENRNGKYRLI